MRSEKFPRHYRAATCFAVTLIWVMTDLINTAKPCHTALLRLEQPRDALADRVRRTGDGAADALDRTEGLGLIRDPIPVAIGDCLPVGMVARGRRRIADRW